MTYMQRTEDKIKAIQWDGNNTDDVIKFCTYKVGSKICTDIELPPEDIAERLKEPQLWISNWYGGDVVYIGDYVVISGEFIKIPKDEFESQWIHTKGNNYKSKVKRQIEAIQWVNNTDEVKAFVGNNGNVDQTGQTFILMNNFGGSVAMSSDYIIKENNNYYSMTADQFNKEYTNDNG